MTVMTKIVATALLVGLAPLATANPVSVDFRISATVPVSCSASLQRNVRQISQSEFQIGELNRFCNTPHMVSVSTISGTNAVLRLDGDVVSVSSGQAIVSPFARAKNDIDGIFVAGVTRAEADQIAQALSVSLTPSGT